MKAVRLSATQLGTALDCKRQWYFEKVLKLPEAPQGDDPTTLGSVLHEVCERYLGADAFGNVPGTNVVADLYPKGWETPGKKPWETSDPQPINEFQQAQVQHLVAAAIEQGVLVRSPTGRVEEQFFFLVLPSTENHGNVFMTGFRDYVPCKGEVEDHKTMKRNKSPWRKTEKALLEDVQARVYSYVELPQAEERGEPLPPTVRFTHNQFSKDPEDPAVRRTSCVFSREVLQEWWTTTVLPMAEDLAVIKENPPEDWQDVPGPKEKSGACNKYGGCRFLKICGKVVSVKRFKKRQTRAVNSATESVTTAIKQESSDMSLADKLAKRMASKQKLANKAKEAPAPAPAPEPQQDETQTVASSPPWANAECKACEGRGFNTKGNPCRMCSMTAKKRGCKPVTDYEVQAMDGMLCWSDGTPEGEGMVEFAPVTVTEAPEPTPPPAPAPEPEPKEEEAPEPEEEEAPEPKTKKKAKAGRPKKAFTLYVNCYPVRGVSPARVAHLSEIMARYGALYAESRGKESYYLLNAFDRRDALCAQAETIKEELGTFALIASPTSPDEAALLAALKPLAHMVVENTSR